MAANKDFLTLFTANKKDAAVNKQVTGLEDSWNSQRARQLRARQGAGRTGPERQAR
jgi:hypothetical protein